MLNRILLTAALCLLAASGSTALAGFDVEFDASVRAGDKTDLYFAISSRYFDRDRSTVERWATRYSDPDRLAVALFISKHSGESLDRIFDLRRQGQGWWEISVRLGLPAEVWFVPVDRAPGPPYGKAYGHWKKHRDNAPAIKMSDADAENLVAVRMLHEYYGVAVDVAMDRRSSGRDLSGLMTDEYSKRHGKSKGKGKGSKGKGKRR